MTRSYLQFDEPGRATVRTEEIPPLSGDELLVSVSRSLVSAGSEMLVYSGKSPAGVALDDTIASIGSETRYPLRYGYACLGSVVDAGNAKFPPPVGTRVFAFHPHASHAAVAASDVLAVPEDLPDARAVFYPNMETALTFVHDGAPRVGESVLVVGLGTVGQLLLFLLAHAGAGRVVAVDRDERRRRDARAALGDRALVCSSVEEATVALAGGGVGHAKYPGFDLAFEVSGNPDALDAAIGAVGFEGRVVIGSWYGDKEARVNLGGRFHRARLSLLSSQVSTIASSISSRWPAARRTAAVWSLLSVIPVDRIATGTIDLSDVPALYEALARGERTHSQYVIRYS